MQIIKINLGSINPIESVNKNKMNLFAAYDGSSDGGSVTSYGHGTTYGSGDDANDPSGVPGGEQLLNDGETRPNDAISTGSPYLTSGDGGNRDPGDTSADGAPSSSDTGFSRDWTD